MKSSERTLQRSRDFFYQTANVFVFLGLLFIPFSFWVVSFQADVSEILFGPIISVIATFFEDLLIVNSTISSDSTTFYLLFLVLLLLSFIISLGLPLLSFWKKNKTNILRIMRLAMTYYLVAVMLKYGLDKVFKAQFYLPEPNTLYTPLGMLDKDILFWSTMGVSYSYNIFMGLMEVIPALLLLYKRTRVIGLFILFLVCY